MAGCLSAGPFRWLRMIFYSKLERCCFNVGEPFVPRGSLPTTDAGCPDGGRPVLHISLLPTLGTSLLPSIVRSIFCYIPSSLISLLTLICHHPSFPTLYCSHCKLQAYRTAAASTEGCDYLFFSLLMPLTRPINVQEEEEPRGYLTIRSLADRPEVVASLPSFLPHTGASAAVS